MENALPYKVSYSNGDVRCKKCHHRLTKERVCIAIMMQSDEDDCHYPEWYHHTCFFELRLPPTPAAFDGFALLRYNDQKTIQESLDLVDVDDETESEKVAVPNFGIEYSRSARDSCNGCNQKIGAGIVRIMKVVQDENQNAVYDGKAVWYHALCFARLRSELNWWHAADAIPGFKRLAEEDKKILNEQIPLMRCETENRPKTETIDLEKRIESQNKEYYQVYDFLEQNVSELDRHIILRKNAQDEFEDQQMLHRLTEIIYFGVPVTCPKCKKGTMVFDNTIYKCSYSKSWTKCDNRENTPLRKPVLVQPTILKKYPFLHQFVGVTRDRILHEFRTTDENGNDLVFGPYKRPPLFNMEFVIIGRLIMTTNEIVKKIRKLGGKVVNHVHAKLAAIISTEEEVRNMTKLMREAKDYNIQVVSENFLTEVMEEADPTLYIISRSICDWGGDPYARIDDNDVKTRRETIYYTKSLPIKVTYKWKDGTAVDPECGLAENAHVYQMNSLKYSVILGLVDIQNNKNSYFRMQLLESNEQQLYWLFESWGRIATVIGNKRLKNYGNLLEARKKFVEIYQEKTGNAFGHLNFIKKPNKFYHLDIVFDIPKKIAGSLIPTNLSAPVYQLMEMLFDVRKMEQMMTSCDLDLKQMPLGKISESQIKLAMITLNEISETISKAAGCSISRLQNLSDKFYTLIPHSFGVNRPPIIDSVDVINAKNEMLESLLNMELIYGFLNEESGEKINPLDACYQKLKAQISPLNKQSFEYQQLIAAVKNTHGVTHARYSLEVMDIFKVIRDGEEERFNEFQTQFPEYDNRALLWHGSRLMNFVSILTNGLKIAPPEAPPTGYMFGKGIYFADSVSKSANYCHVNSRKEPALLLLCEVQLGQPQNVISAQNIINIPNANFQSVKGNGLFSAPDWQTVDGLKMALGPLVPLKKQTPLVYNEYIVYNPAQVRIKYLCKMEFDFK